MGANCKIIGKGYLIKSEILLVSSCRKIKLLLRATFDS